MKFINKLFLSSSSVKDTICNMISQQEQELLRYKSGSPLAKRCNDKVAVLKELADRLAINLYD